jgi:peptidoglycan/LPS O-acetylase OafA/YrhL
MIEMSVMAKFLFLNWHRALMGGIIVTCSVIFLMGILKKFVFNRVQNKLGRKVLLYFCSIVLVFPITALYFLSDGISFTWYWWGCLLSAMLMILTYSLYENTGLRNIIDLIGGLVVNKWLKVFYEAFVSKIESKALKNQLAMTTAELKEEVRKEIHNTIKEDKDLKGL